VNVCETAKILKDIPKMEVEFMNIEKFIFALIDREDIFAVESAAYTKAGGFEIRPFYWRYKRGLFLANPIKIPFPYQLI
jgi:hypothetical protein